MAALDGTAWRLEGAGDERAPTIAFADWRVAGCTGVNQFGGPYESPAGALVFGPMTATKMAGPEPAMAVERELLALLAGTRPYAVAGGALTIGEGTATRRFVAAS